MKKLISLILVVVMAFSLSVVVFAAKLGDVNEDGKVSAQDALMVLQYAAGSRTLTAAQQKKADCNKDGKVSAVDARKILQMVAGLIPEEEMSTSTPPGIGGGEGNDSISWDEILGA